MTEPNERDIYSAVEREVLGRSFAHRTCYYDYPFCLTKIHKNILKSDGINLSQDQIVKVLKDMMRGFVSDHSDIFRLVGLFYIDNEVVFRIKVSPPKLKT